MFYSLLFLCFCLKKNKLTCSGLNFQLEPNLLIIKKNSIVYTACKVIRIVFKFRFFKFVRITTTRICFYFVAVFIS